MASQEERRRFVEEFLASEDIASLPSVHRSIYKGQALEMLATLAMRPIPSFSHKDLDAFVEKKGRSPDASVAEKVGVALLKYLSMRIDVPAPEAPAPPPPAVTPSLAPPRRTIAAPAPQRGLVYTVSGPKGEAIKGRMMAGILATGRMFAQHAMPLDHTLRSLATMDAYFESEAPDGQAKPGTELALRRAEWVLAIAAYVAAILANEMGGGRLEIDENDPEADLNVALHLPNGRVLNPVLRVIGRLDLGAVESLARYGELATKAP